MSDSTSPLEIGAMKKSENGTTKSLQSEFSAIENSFGLTIDTAIDLTVDMNNADKIYDSLHSSDVGKVREIAQNEGKY